MPGPVPNRADHPNRKINHYQVTHNTWEGTGGGASLSKTNTQYFDSKKPASEYIKAVSKLGYNVNVVKHDKDSIDAGYTKGKVDHLMEAKASLQKFFGPNPY